MHPFRQLCEQISEGLRQQRPTRVQILGALNQVEANLDPNHGDYPRARALIVQYREALTSDDPADGKKLEGAWFDIRHIGRSYDSA